jgi:trimeric autotransporter adhesin
MWLSTKCVTKKRHYKMKKLFYKIFVALNFYACVALMLSCGSNAGGSGTTNPTTTTTPVATPIVEPNVYIGGQFSFVGGTIANGFATLSNSKWSSVGEFQSANKNNRIYALTKDQNGKIIVGGAFGAATGLDSTVIARWDNGWSSIGTLTLALVTSIAVHSGGTIYAGGIDSNLTGGSVQKFDGTSWTNLGGCPVYIYSIILDAQGVPFIGCGANRIKDATGYVKKWNGTNWTDLGSGMNGGVTSLVFDSAGNLYAGGDFSSANGVAANGISKWNGTTWEALGTGQTGTVYSLVFDSAGILYAAGDALQSGNVASWDGSSWKGLAMTPNKGVFKIIFDSSGRLYAGGNFTAAGTTPADGFARWDGTTWSAMGNNTDSSSVIRAIAIE